MIPFSYRLLSIGIGALSKLSIGLLPFWLCSGLLFTARGRATLRQPHFWLGLLLLFVCMSPMLWWNAQHDWVMLHHELGHVQGIPGLHTYDWSDFWEFVGGQWLALSPLVALILLPIVARRPHHAAQRMLWVTAWLTLGFFLLKALSSKVQLNWPAPAYIGFLVLFAGHIPQLGMWQKRLMYAGFALYRLDVLVTFFPHSFYLSAKQDSLRKMRYWREPVAQLAQQTPAKADFLWVTYYQLGAELAYYWPQRKTVYLTRSSQRRLNQFDVWPSIQREKGCDGVFVHTAVELPDDVNQAFAACSALPHPVPATAPDGTVIRTLYAWPCENYHGLDEVVSKGF